MASHSGCSKVTPALTKAAIISPFQSASALSSSPGLTRFSRNSNSLPRSIEIRAASVLLRRGAIPGAAPGSMLRGKYLSRLRIL